MSAAKIAEMMGKMAGEERSLRGNLAREDSFYLDGAVRGAVARNSLAAARYGAMNLQRNNPTWSSADAAKAVTGERSLSNTALSRPLPRSPVFTRLAAEDLFAGRPGAYYRAVAADGAIRTAIADAGMQAATETSPRPFKPDPGVR